MMCAAELVRFTLRLALGSLAGAAGLLAGGRDVGAFGGQGHGESALA
jgi:hypothetical protein